MSDPIPTYDPYEPARLQENDWDCSVESCEWQLYAWGRAPDDNWLENSMIAAGVVSPAQGLLDASGAGLASWINTEYGEFGYEGSSDPDVSFDDVAAEAATEAHPLQIGGRGWYHWSGVRGYDPSNDLLLLANPAPGWKGVYQDMSRGQFASLGPFSLVRIRHPEAEGEGGDETTDGEGPDAPADLSPWFGLVGTGLLEMMAADGTQPAQRWSTWLPLGGPPPADIEECVGENGVTYRWLLTTNAGYRYRPD